jgi:hypothetical protein
MSTSAWRLLFLPLVLLAILLVGTPDFPALERAIRKAFEAHVVREPDSPHEGTRSARLQPPVVAVLQTRVTSDAATPIVSGRGILVPLYASFVALQALDAHSTLRAMDGGASEANPLMGAIARKPAALLAVKAGVAGSTIYLVEKVRVRNRKAAIALMTALNSLYAAIVAHNYRVPR